MKQRPEIAERKATTILLNEVGWKARKNPAAEKCFFLDSFYRTYQELGVVCDGLRRKNISAARISKYHQLVAGDAMAAVFAGA